MRPYYYLGNNRGLTNLVMGYKMIVDTSDFSLGAHVISDGYWANHIDSFLGGVIQKGDKCMDIGCHMGYVSMFMYGCSGQPVVCVDVNPEMVELTQANFELNGLRGTFINAGLVTGDVNTAHFAFRNANNSGSSHLHWTGDGKGGVKAKKAKALFDEHKPDFVKVDTEGMDWFIMDTISPDRAIIEHRPNDARRFEGTPLIHDSLENCMERVFKKYRVGVIGEDRFVIAPKAIMGNEHLDLYLQKR